MFPFGKEESGDFEYCGIQVRSVVEDGMLVEVQLDQGPFVQGLREVPEESRCSAECQKLVGSLLWLTGQTRPDAACQVAMLASVARNPSPQHWHQIHKLLKGLKRKSVTLRFGRGG